jgi:hypothetical protein
LSDNCPGGNDARAYSGLTPPLIFNATR